MDPYYNPKLVTLAVSDAEPYCRRWKFLVMKETKFFPAQSGNVFLQTERIVVLSSLKMTETECYYFFLTQSEF